MDTTRCLQHAIGWPPGYHEKRRWNTNKSSYLHLHWQQRDERKKSIPTDDQIQHLYSSGSYKYLAENRNDDICVADCYANEVVVVSANGNLRFRYTGHFSKDMGEFTPRAIATDSQANILTTDWVNHCVHIIDRDGHFLRFIDNCNLQHPYGLSVDTEDNLFVAELSTGRVKKIQYFMWTYLVYYEYVLHKKKNDKRVTNPWRERVNTAISVLNDGLIFFHQVI